MLKQVHGSPTVYRQLSNEAGIIKENTLRELTIVDDIGVYPRHCDHLGLHVRKLRESF